MALIAFCITLLVQLTTPVPPDLASCAFDGKFYGAMASSSGEAWYVYQAPWCWRVLTPWMVSILPLPTLTAFQVLNFVFAWLNVALVGWLAQRICTPKSSALAAMLLYSGVFWSLKFSFYCPCYIDIQTQTFFLIVLCLLEVRRYRIIPWVLALGVLQKESIVLLAPVVAIEQYCAQRDRKKALLYLLVLLGFCGVALAAVRGTITPVNQYLSEAAFRQQLVYDLESLLSFRSQILVNLLSGLGLLWLIAIWRGRVLLRFLRGNPQWAAVIVLGILPLFAGTDKGRFFLYMLPAVTIVAVYCLHPVLRALERRDRVVCFWVAATLLLHFYIGHLLSPAGAPEEVFSRMGQWPALTSVDAYRFIVCAVAWVILTIWLMRRRPQLLQVVA
ncbi:MAG: hypothetical protein J0M12_15345 [Deltaproteobacteria bacterium]|nr:hypothetical protein [Deltaproteobacteria bacterium]